MLPPAGLDQAIQGSRRRLGFAGKYDLGVLLVHGIGEQARGDTLTEQGDHLVRWLRGRVGDTGKPTGPKVDVLDVTARQSRTGDAIPSAHAVLRITPPAGTDQVAHWVVAEAWWAESFRPASYGELAGWGVTIGPWVFATEVAGIVRRLEIGEGVPTLLRIALIPVTLVAGAALLALAAIGSFLMTVLAVALVLVAYTNLPFFADAARGLQANLAGGFGDAYVMTRSPVRFGAMAAQVRSGIQALRRECSSVAVVAESMGTAVAWYALKHEVCDPPAEDDKPAAKGRIGLFLTHGQALRKLTFVLRMARGEQTDRQTLAAIGSSAFLGLAIAAFLLGAPLWLVAASIGLAAAAQVYLLVSAIDAWKAAGKEIETDWQEVLAAEPQLEWLDLWASADPFALGPLDVEGEQVQSFKIRNLGSTISDHVTYWRNTTEFLPLVTSILFRLGGPRSYAADLTDPRLEVPAMRRHARVLMRSVMRVVVGVGLTVGLLYAWLTPDFGSGLVDFVAGLNLPFISDFFERPPDWVVAIAGYVTVAAAAVLVWTPITLAWNALMRLDEATLFSGTRRPLWSLPWYVFGAMAFPIGAVVVALLWRADEPMLAVAYLLGASFMVLLSLAVLSGGGQTYASDEASERTLAAARRIREGRPAVGIGVTAVLAAALVVVPLVAFFAAPDLIVPILVAEAVLLSAVLAAEGLREYLVFRRRFAARNQLLPDPRDTTAVLTEP